jgi:long-chain acyl-CoA synthetase
MEKIWLAHYPKGVPHQLQYAGMSLSEMLAGTAQELPNHTAITFMGARISFREFDEMVNSIANALTDFGIKTGDKVAMLMPNMPQMVIATYACWRIGAAVVMNNPMYSDRELEHNFNNSQTAVLITVDLLAPRMLALKPKTSIKKIIIARIGDHLPLPKEQLMQQTANDEHKNSPHAPDIHEWLDLIKQYPATDPCIPAAPDTVATLQFTGGTTGVSKAAMLTHANLYSNAQQMRAWLHTMKKGSGSILCALPYFHSFGILACMNMGILQGWNQVLILRPDIETILKTVVEYKINIFPAVPTIYTGVVNHPDIAKYNLGSIEASFSAGAPLPVTIIHKFLEISGSQICEAYGLTEASPCVTLNPFKGMTKPGSVGIPLPNTEIKLVNPEDGITEVPRGEEGEILVKGPQVMKGYFNKPSETESALKEGWLHTGDVGKLDEDGFLYIVDRIKDMIIASGYNIYPNEIDQVLFSHPKILEACAVGVPDAYRGETVKAFIVIKPGEVLTAEEVVEYCTQNLAKYKIPKLIEFVENIPKSAVGKILRKELRRMDLDKNQADAAITAK